MKKVWIIMFLCCSFYQSCLFVNKTFVDPSIKTDIEKIMKPDEFSHIQIPQSMLVNFPDLEANLNTAYQSFDESSIKYITQSLTKVLGLNHLYVVVEKHDDSIAESDIIRPKKTVKPRSGKCKCGSYSKKIKYNPTCLERIRNTGISEWSTVGLIAHELAHYLYVNEIYPNFFVKSDEFKETEADIFIGFALKLAGASENEATSVIDAFEALKRNNQLNCVPNPFGCPYASVDMRKKYILYGWWNAHIKSLQTLGKKIKGKNKSKFDQLDRDVRNYISQNNCKQELDATFLAQMLPFSIEVEEDATAFLDNYIIENNLDYDSLIGTYEQAGYSNLVVFNNLNTAYPVSDSTQNIFQVLSDTTVTIGKIVAQNIASDSTVRILNMSNNQLFIDKNNYIWRDSTLTDDRIGIFYQLNNQK